MKMNKPAVPGVVKLAERFVEAAHAATSRMQMGKEELKEYFLNDFKALALITTGLSERFLDIVGDTSETLVAGLDKVFVTMAGLTPVTPIGKARMAAYTTNEHN
jgi:hypothetical protein